MKKNLYKYFNICTVICLISYILAGFSFYFTTDNQQKKYQLEYERLMQETLDFNSGKQNGDTTNIEQEKPIFLDAKSAINYAFFNFYNAKSYEMETEGTVNAGSFGVIATVLTQGFQVLYSNGNVYTETKQYELKNSLGANLGQSKASSYYFQNGNIFFRETKNVAYNNKVITSNYSTNFNKIAEGKHNSYIVNNNTIAKSTFFSVNYNAYTGKIKSYSASAKLNVITAVKGLDAQMQREGVLNSLPKFSNLEIHCIISKSGELKAFTIEQEYTSSKTIDVLGNVNYSSSDKITNVIKSLNKIPSILEPQI